MTSDQNILISIDCVDLIQVKMELVKLVSFLIKKVYLHDLMARQVIFPSKCIILNTLTATSIYICRK